MKIKIDYDGKYPTLCMGNLKVTVGGKEYIFPNCCLSSGGSVTFDEDWNEDVSIGEWSVNYWPENMPDDIKQDVLDKINQEIPYGCCGGCI